MDRSPCSKQPRGGNRRRYPTWRLGESRAAPCRHSEKSLYQQPLSPWERVPGEGEHPLQLLATAASLLLPQQAECRDFLAALTRTDLRLCPQCGRGILTRVSFFPPSHLPVPLRLDSS